LTGVHLATSRVEAKRASGLAFEGSVFQEFLQRSLDTVRDLPWLGLDSHREVRGPRLNLVSLPDKLAAERRCSILGQVCLSLKALVEAATSRQDVLAIGVESRKSARGSSERGANGSDRHDVRTPEDGLALPLCLQHEWDLAVTLESEGTGSSRSVD